MTDSEQLRLLKLEHALHIALALFSECARTSLSESKECADD